MEKPARGNLEVRMEDTDIGAVDPDLGRFRSPVKMARKALEGLEGVTWIEPLP